MCRIPTVPHSDVNPMSINQTMENPISFASFDLLLPMKYLQKCMDVQISLTSKAAHSLTCLNVPMIGVGTLFLWRDSLETREKSYSGLRWRIFCWLSRA